MATDLFEPVEAGALRLANRIVMTAMTRARAGAGDVPTPLMAEYYRQRASAGLIISEGIAVSPMARGYYRTPGLYTDAQLQGWRMVTDAVHAAGGLIQAQLWHVGRISHPDTLPPGRHPLAPSAITAETSSVYAGEGFLPCAPPVAMTQADIVTTIDEFVHAARGAMASGFDGVQIHGGNGYLIDQFLKAGANHRTDAYGGAIMNRIRFVLELTGAVAAAVGSGRLSLRIAPTTMVNDVSDPDPQTLFVRLCEELGRFDLAFLDVVEGQTVGPREDGGFDPDLLRRAYRGLYLGNNGYTPDLAIAARAAGKVDLVGFGRAFITNPDLVERMRVGRPIAPEPERDAYYGGDAAGYTDFPRYA